ncbi:MAG: hypothetical protein AMJ79_14565 [Phycisphaerae bacterium SM23_30]|nr:MAG: hypothetical protein AMJ79_14565 [Phycisphaerae bacterium SM23_30]
MKKPKMKLHTKIFIGMGLGVVFGLLVAALEARGLMLGPETTPTDALTSYIKPVGDLFINMIKMIIVPLVFASLLVGSASLSDIRKLGRIGGKTLLYFLITTVVALSFGLLIANTLQPGKGISAEDRDKLLKSEEAQEAMKKIEDARAQTERGEGSIKETLLGIVPSNPVQALTEGNLLQIIFVALMMGIALTLIPPERARPVIKFFEAINDVMIVLVNIFMKVAPYGVFALISYVVATCGSGVLLLLLKYVALTIGGMFVIVITMYPIALKILTKMRVADFFRGVRQAMIISFSTSSSGATLPVTIECCEENLGVSKDVASFVLPLGATINMNGTAIYQSVSALFIAQVFGIPLGLNEQLTIVLMATLASIGAAGAPGVGVIMLLIVLDSVGLPPEGFALVIGVERILDMCRTVLNITGDASCAVVVASSEKELADIPPMKLIREN